MIKDMIKTSSLAALVNVKNYKQRNRFAFLVRMNIPNFPFRLTVFQVVSKPKINIPKKNYIFSSI